nr:hypothetical protein CVCH_165 [Cavernulicola chilensis]
MNCPVPEEQLPCNEYKAMKESYFYYLPKLNLINYYIFIGTIWILTGILMNQIIFESFSIFKSPISYILVSTITTNVIINVILIHIYLGWSYISKRLISATVIYEESGWYDGQIWIKPSNILTKDRLINNYEIIPILLRVKRSIIILSILLIIQTLIYTQE